MKYLANSSNRWWVGFWIINIIIGFIQPAHFVILSVLILWALLRGEQ